MPNSEGAGAAAPEEVLRVISQVMHTGDKPADQLKAADMLAKYHGLLAPKEEPAVDPGLIGEIEAAVKAIADEYEEPEPEGTGGSEADDDTAGAGGPVVRA